MNLDLYQNLKKKITHNALTSIFFAESGHPGGVLSCMDILIYIFFNEIGPKIKLKSKDRNRFILSKGHSVPALYAVVKELGYLNKSDLKNLRKINSKTQGHPALNATNWIECNTGSLGQGISYSTGLALSYKLQKFKKKIYCMIGDGEMQEGQVWESLMFASHHKLNNLCVFLDYNKMQSDDLNKNIISLEPIKDKVSSFGWNYIVIDGHKVNEIKKAIEKFKKSKKPLFVIANTIKGNSISFMKNKPLWHGSVKLKKDEILKIYKELKTKEKIEIL